MYQFGVLCEVVTHRVAAPYPYKKVDKIPSHSQLTDFTITRVCHTKEYPHLDPLCIRFSSLVLPHGRTSHLFEAATLPETKRSKHSNAPRPVPAESPVKILNTASCAVTPDGAIGVTE